MFFGLCCCRNDKVIEPESEKVVKTEIEHGPSRLCPTIQWTPGSLRFPHPLGEEQLNATCYYYRRDVTVRGNFIYTPPAGTVLPAGVHKLTALFIPEDVSMYKSISKIIEFEVFKGAPELKWELPTSWIPYGDLLLPEFFQCTSSEETQGQCFFSHEPITRLERGKHKLAVQYVPHDKENYCNSYMSQYLRVGGLSVDILWEDIEDIYYPAPLTWNELSAKVVGDVPGSFTYTPGLRDVLPAGEYLIEAVFTPADIYTYHVTKISKEITVLRSAPELVWEKPFSLYHGEALDERTLNCHSKDPAVTGEFEYSHELGEVLPVGSYILRATFHPDDSDNYTESSTTVPLLVRPMQLPVVSWPNPPSLVFPMGLSNLQLCASVESCFPGRLEYDHKLYEVLPVGKHVLSVKFHPLNTRSVLPATCSVSLTVEPGQPLLAWATPSVLLDGDLLTEKELNCTCNLPGGEFQYDPPLETRLEGAGRHVLRVHYIPEDIANYREVDASVFIKLLARPAVSATIRWDYPGDLFYPTPLRLGASDTLCARCVEDEGVLAYSPSIGTILPVGQHVLKVTFVPFRTNIKTLTTSMTITLTVKKPPFILTWEPKSTEIVFGTVLSNIHCNAVFRVITEDSGPNGVQVHGKYIYDPPMGTVLEANDHILKVTFLPEDEENYPSGSLTTKVSVSRSRPIVMWPEKATEEIVFPSTLSEDLHLAPFTVITKKQLMANLPRPTGKFKLSHTANDVLSVGEHEIHCRFYPDDIINYYSCDATLTVTVVKGKPQVRFIDPNAPITLVYGEEIDIAKHYRVEVTNGVEGTWTYNPGQGIILDACLDFTITATFHPSEPMNYETVSVSRNIDVVPKTIHLTWATPANIPYGEILSETQLNAELDLPQHSAFHLMQMAGGRISYLPRKGSLLRAGKDQILSASYKVPKKRAHNFSAVKCSVLITVEKVLPPLSWNPSKNPILFGQPLSEAHLCAKSEAVGQFQYHPSIGTVLPQSRQKIDLLFRPYNTTCYHNVTAHTYVLVVKNVPKITWDPPNPVRVGYKMTKRDFDAVVLLPEGESKPIDGEFVYNRKPGAVFDSIGKVILTAQFFPNKEFSMQYRNSERLDVIITVLPPPEKTAAGSKNASSRPKPVSNAMKMLTQLVQSDKISRPNSPQEFTSLPPGEEPQVQEEEDDNDS